MPDIKTDVLPWLQHGLFDNQNSHRKSKGEFMNVGNIFDVSMHTCWSGSGGGKTH